MSRFVDIDESVVEVFLEIIEQRFPALAQLKIKLLFDTKRKIKDGDVCLASSKLANDEIKFFSKDNIAVDGYDVVIVFDMKAWQLANTVDRNRLMSHELRHIFIDEKGGIKLIPHDVSDFRIEQSLNKDDPEWGSRLAVLVNDIYEQEKEMAKQSKAIKKENNYGG